MGNMADPSIPTPSPLPSPSDNPHSLSDRINIATRPIHSQLNRLILARFPLALPPYTTTPSTYISGLLYITPIYITFESLWQSILDAPPSPSISSKDSDPSTPLLGSADVLAFLPVATPALSSRTHSLLTNLQLPGLLRRKRLVADICVLSGASESAVENQLRRIAGKGKLAIFINRTERAVETNPHVLIAYAWVLYMALFSGGRYLRASLRDAGGLEGHFWSRDPSPVRPYDATSSITNSPHPRAPRSEPGRRMEWWESPEPERSRVCSEISMPLIFPGMLFFNFDGDKDGEDIKADFKKRITECENLLTEGEKLDVIAEAQTIFEFVIELIGELDDIMGTNKEDVESERLHQRFRVKMTSRDSLAVAQDRIQKRERSESDLLPPSKLGQFDSLISDPVSQLRNAMPSLSTVTKSGRRVAFNPAIEMQPSNIGARVTLMTSMTFLAAGVALFTAWCWLV